MQCPDCGSHYTQAVSLAYSQSIRTGYNGNQSISEYGKELAPPAPRSEFAIPFLVAVSVFVAALFLLPNELRWMDVKWITRLFSALWGRLGLSGALAVPVLLYMSGSAMAHNIADHSKEMKSWGRGVICRRCGHQFRR